MLEFLQDVSRPVPLEFAALHGGPMRERLDRARKEDHAIRWRMVGPLSLLTNSTVLAGEMKRCLVETSTQSAAQSIEVASRYRDSRLEAELIESLGLSIDWSTYEASAFYFGEWAEALFPQCFQRMPKAIVTGALNALKEDLPERERVLPWNGLGYFPAYLKRSSSLEAAELASIEWARFQALYSPQDEALEKSRVKGDDVIVNPTLQTAKQDQSRNLVCLWRIQTPCSTLQEESIGWMEAALIDHTAENFRISRTALLAEVESEFKTGAPGARTKTFAEALEQLIKREIILGSNESS